MKRTIRLNAFETNSSSMHSIVVAKKSKPLTKEEFEDELCNGVLKFWSNELEFGRNFRFLKSVSDKIAFAIASCCGVDLKENEKFITDLTEKLKEKYPGFVKIELPEEQHKVFVNAEGEEIPYGKVHYKSKDKYVYVDDDRKEREAIPTEDWSTHFVFGYVDHQSYGVLQNYLRDRGVSLIDFITDKRYTVVIDGDEYDIFQDMIDAEVIDTYKLIENYPYEVFDTKYIGED